MYKGSLRDIVEHADRELPRDILPDPLPVGGHRVEEEVPQPPDDDLGPEVLPSAGHVPPDLPVAPFPEEGPVLPIHPEGGGDGKTVVDPRRGLPPLPHFPVEDRLRPQRLANLLGGGARKLPAVADPQRLPQDPVALGDRHHGEPFPGHSLHERVADDVGRREIVRLVLHRRHRDLRSLRQDRRRRFRADLLPPSAPRRGQEDRNDDQDRNRRPSPAAMHRHSSSTQRMQVTGQRSIASWIAAASAPSGSWTSARLSASNRNTAGTVSTHTPQAMHSSLLTYGTRFIFNPRAIGPSIPDIIAPSPFHRSGPLEPEVPRERLVAQASV